MGCNTRLLEPDLISLEYITMHMRPADRAEVYNVLNHDNPFILARQVIDLSMSPGTYCVVAHLHRPVAILGFTERHAGVCEAFSFGTMEFSQCALALTRCALRVIKPSLINAGIHRIQCKSRIDHVEAHQWLTYLGFTAESVLKSYGKDGSDYIQFAALRG